MAIVYGASAAGQWFSMAPNIAQATSAANRILSMRPNSKAPPPSYTPIEKATGSVGIEFRNVDFAYKSRSVPVLSNLNMTIAPGQFAALVGASGCGKSTTISLLERFYDAVSGAVLYNGQDITTLDPALYRQNVSARQNSLANRTCQPVYVDQPGDRLCTSEGHDPPRYQTCQYYAGSAQSLTQSDGRASPH